MISITAATGNVGRIPTRLLPHRHTPDRLLVRDPVGSDVDGGVIESIQVDLDDGDSLDSALVGVTHFFLLSPASGH